MRIDFPPDPLGKLCDRVGHDIRNIGGYLICSRCGTNLGKA